MNIEKSKTIKASLKETKDRRKSQSCKVFEVKFDKSHLSTEKKRYLHKLFLEAKWLYNNILASGDVFSFCYKSKEAYVRNKNKEIELRELKALSSQMKQGICDRTINSIVALCRLRGKGHKIGRLKFKPEINSIPLKQFGSTYRIENDKYIKLQGCKKHFKVMGLGQIPDDAEFANANLIRKAGDYYFKITCFIPKETHILNGKAIGLDFGIETSVTTSNGNKYNFQFPEPKSLRKKAKLLSKRKKRSKNRTKAKVKLCKAYKKLTNQKRDAKNKFVFSLKNGYETICVQNENIKGWHESAMKGFGRKVQWSIMGGIMSGLKKHPATTVVDRYFQSTQLCPICGDKNKHSLDKRTYNCSCGYSCDRDVHAAKNILYEGLRQIGAERTDTMPVERSSPRIQESSSDFQGERVEAGSLYSLA